MSSFRDFVLIYVNGKPVQVHGDKTSMMLADFLRYELGLVGTKIVCAEGDCGACTVVRYFPLKGGKVVYEPLNSCITTIAQMDGSSLVTVDALDNQGELTPAQSAMVSCHASQCGFCTPGFVMALTGLTEKKLAENKNSISDKEAKNAFTGNLCRCTGYQPLVNAACKTQVKATKPLAKRFWSSEQSKHLTASLKKGILIKGTSFVLFAPKTLKAAAGYLAKNSDARLISGGTDLGVLVNKGKFKPVNFLSLHLIPELYNLKTLKGNKISVGARVSLGELRRFCLDSVPEFARFLDIFASPQIKNVATLAGNIGNASPIADTPPFLFATNAVQTVVGPKGVRRISIDDFYLDYKKTSLKKGEFIAFVEFDVPYKKELFSLYKSSQRKDLDISCVNAAFRLNLSKSKLFSEVRMAFGGVGPVPFRAKKLETYLEGKAPTAAVITEANQVLQKEISPIGDLRGSASFRRVLAGQFLTQFLAQCSAQFPETAGRA